MDETSGTSRAAEIDQPRLSETEIAQNAVEFSHQAEKLSHQQPSGPSPEVAIEAHFVTPQDPVIVTSDGNRLPGVPLQEAHKLNVLREELQGKPESVEIKEGDETKERISNTDDNQVQQHKEIGRAHV